MDENVLHAKAPKAGKHVTLLEHTRDVVHAAKCMFGDNNNTPTRLARKWLEFFRIQPAKYAMFRATLLASAWLHDWGKANDGFIAAVTRRDNQVIRHEHLSALLLETKGVRDWLQTNGDIDIDIALSSVLTHHLKAKPESVAQRMCDVQLCRVYTDHDEFREMLEETATDLGLGAPPDLTEQLFFGFLDEGKPLPRVECIQDRRKKVKQQLEEFEKTLLGEDGNPTPKARLLWAVRSALIAADAAGSGLRREGRDSKTILTWLRKVFDENDLWDATRIENHNIAPRINTIPGYRQTPLQGKAETLGPRTLLLAPCGSGKTLAAWYWIQGRLAENPCKRVIFLYPTRATAKEGFRDYVSWAPGAAAGLMHGTAEFDLDGMFQNSSDERSHNNYEAERKLFALGFWTKQVFSATVDQFLSFLQYSYSSMCMLPALVDSVVVIDEVHCFDDNMLSSLKKFLTTFKIPVLCMTATLPSDRQRELEACDLQLCSESENGPTESANAPRYHVRQLPSDPGKAGFQIEAAVRDALENGLRVLWVVNQVKKAQQIARQWAKEFRRTRGQQNLFVKGFDRDVPLYCYHSRFRLVDRRDRHDQVVGEMSSANTTRRAALAITTQVCEMSLDLDVDLLVTEECPITSLIQRMGRCNRAKAIRSWETNGQVLVYEPIDRDGKRDIKPYTPDQLSGMKDFLEKVATRSDDKAEPLRPLSQHQLELELGKIPPPMPTGDRACMFLESGAYAQAGEESFRDIEDFSVQAILDTEIVRFANAKEVSEKQGLILPVPKGKRLDEERLAVRKIKRPAELPRYLHIAPAEYYHDAVGFCDDPLYQPEEEE